MDANQVLEDLRGLLANFEGREYSAEITRDTLFFGDMGMASIDAVVLGEKLQAHYDQTLPFPKFLSQLAEQGAEDLTVGELADFLADHVAG